MPYIGEHSNIHSAYRGMLNSLSDESIAAGIGSRNGHTTEVSPALYEVKDFSHYILESDTRIINFPFALAEIIWIMGGHHSDWISYFNKQIIEYADNWDEREGDHVFKRKIFNAAYGKRMRRSFDIDQYADVINTLQKDENSRQAVIIYRHPKGDASDVETKDRACNISSMFLVRDDKLNIVQTTRSQDVIWGVPYNWIQFGYIAQSISEILGVRVGSFTGAVNSLHIYDNMYKHGYDIIEEMNKFDTEKKFMFDIPRIGVASKYDYASLCDYIKYCITIDVDSNFYYNNYNESVLKQIDAMRSPFLKDALIVLFSYTYRRFPDISLKILEKLESRLFYNMTLKYYKKYWNNYWKDA